MKAERRLPLAFARILFHSVAPYLSAECADARCSSAYESHGRFGIAIRGHRPTTVPAARMRRAFTCCMLEGTAMLRHASLLSSTTRTVASCFAGSSRSMGKATSPLTASMRSGTLRCLRAFGALPMRGSHRLLCFHSTRLSSRLRRTTRHTGTTVRWLRGKCVV